MLATLASVGYVHGGFAQRSAVSGAAQTARSAAVMFEPPPTEETRDMKGDVISSAHCCSSHTHDLHTDQMPCTPAKHPADSASHARADDGMQSNFGRLSDKLKEADLERRMEDEEVSRLSAVSNAQRANARQTPRACGGG